MSTAAELEVLEEMTRRVRALEHIVQVSQQLGLPAADQKALEATVKPHLTAALAALPPAPAVLPPV